MSNNPASLFAHIRKSWLKLTVGPAVLGIFTMFGLFFWSGCSRPPQMAAIPAQAARIEPSPTATVALGPHLHFEVRQDDPHSYESVRNPELWYRPYAGRGVLAGRLVDANGVFQPGTRVNLDCSDGTPRTVETYWDQYTAPDNILVENFVISDLPTGTCRVWAETPRGMVEQSVEIIPGELSGVVLQLRP